MGPNLIERSPAAYSYPLLIKHLLHTALSYAPEQEIVYRSRTRYTYRAFHERIGGRKTIARQHPALASFCGSGERPAPKTCRQV